MRKNNMSASLNWEKKRRVSSISKNTRSWNDYACLAKRKTLLADINIIDISALGHIDSTGLALLFT